MKSFTFMMPAVALLALNSCKPATSNSQKLEVIKKNIEGTWKVTNAKINEYNKGILRKNADYSAYDNYEFTMMEGDSFTVKTPGNDGILKGHWYFYVTDKEDYDHDALSEGESSTYDILFNYTDEQGQQYKKECWSSTFSKHHHQMNSELETPDGDVKITLTRQ